MQAYGLKRAGLVLAAVMVIALGITAAGRARRPQVVVFEGSAEARAAPGQCSSVLSPESGAMDGGDAIKISEASSDAHFGPSSDQPAASAASAVSTGSTLVAEPALIVHVAGAVANPGVYSLWLGARVVDALTAAGGATKAADTDCINLALPVRDGEQIYVSTRQSNGGAPQSAIVASGASRAGGYEPMPVNRADISRSVPGPDSAAGSSAIAGSAGVAQAGLVNVNTASAEELESLPGVGPVLARRIVDYRASNGPFATVDDLVGVSGIGQAKLEKLAPRATTR